MEYNKKYLFYVRYFFSIILIILIFSASVLAVTDSEEKSNLENHKLEKQASINHILYSLQVIDITRKNLSKVNLDRLQYYFEDSDQEFNLIYRDQLVELLGDNFEILFDAAREAEKTELILEPKILVAPGHTATMYVAQEELFLDVESVDSIIYSNVFELELYPRNSFTEDDSVFTDINLKTGQGPTGLETEIWIKPNTPYLLGVMEDSRSEKIKKIMGNSWVMERRYFALYLSAKPAGILTLPDLSSSLAGLGKIFTTAEITRNKGSVILKTAVEENDDKNHSFSLAGFYQNQLKWRTDFTINEVLTGRNLVAVTGHLNDDLWMGIELIILEEDEVEVALKLRDKVVLGPFIFTASFNPLSYNFEDDRDGITWYLKAETVLGQNLNFALEYRSLSESDFAGVDFTYDFNNYALLLGHTWNLDIENEKAYWLGLQFSF
ncbi:hypothetical protein C8C77_10414 [Halanaerobium saccharolyticum]|uniref:Uncharacterized protein n=1 Tax=Halanaerobium saccharolyticum TaxID=43595 RepID=A0A4R7Z7A1_9FIRM|nr:hypothetical protein [Halanaerobium saccharolyticum]RAK10617.1 hypothetical protein C7958_104138 [Halanaerobium saccharolyticum]TDW06626.1 hypothetical protein C8C77_10414 [Halanaerobium saccharolyticum]TDX62261.1 hypothetical protein C7956_10414 [Halanaerobium saccharolyticum]